jgi:bacteriocin biosynthesis cyclodehydratase domain-containing protein
MEPDAISESGKTERRPLPELLRLGLRFSVYQVGRGEFRIQSATENIRIDEAENEELVAELLSALLDPCEYDSLLGGFTGDHREAAEAFLRDLMEKGVLEDASGASEIEGDRYAHQRLFFSHFDTGQPPLAGADDAKKDSHATIRQASVLVIGLGMIGMFLTQALARCGVGKLTLADPEMVTPEDAWLTDYTAEDVGHSRAEIMARRVSRLNPDVEPVPVLCRLPTGLPDAAAFSGQDLVVLCPDAFVPQAYDAVNRMCLETGVDWINYRKLGFDVTVGPLVIPGQSPCYKCADLRGLGNLSDITERLYLREYFDSGGRLETGQLPLPAGGDFLAAEVVKHLSGASQAATIGHVLHTSAINLLNRLRPLLKIPRCPHCGLKEGKRPLIDSWFHE